MTSVWTRPDVLSWARGVVGELSEDALPRLARRARDELGPDAGPVALSLARHRVRHRDKFPGWHEFVADGEAFQQASGEAAARWRAERFRDSERVLDLCCGAGADTIALSGTAREVVGVDVDRERLAWARHNVAAYGGPGCTSFLAADCTRALPEADAATLDPDRRAGNARRRAIRPHEYSPPLDAWDRIRRAVGTLAVKVAPGIPYADIPPDAVPEFVQDRGECREAVLWFGERAPDVRQAVVLPRGDVIREDELEELAVGDIGDVIYDPGPAVVRSHLVTQLAARLDARRIDEQIAYLTADDAPADTPFAAAFRVEKIVPWSLKRLRRMLADERVGALEIRARRFPVRPDELRGLLRLEGDAHRTLICTRVSGRAIAALCTPA